MTGEGEMELKALVPPVVQPIRWTFGRADVEGVGACPVLILHTPGELKAYTLPPDAADRLSAQLAEQAAKCRAAITVAPADALPIFPEGLARRLNGNGRHG